jgi:DNA-binding NtrC family response regulator
MSIIQGKKILIVDGDLGVRESIRMILEMQGAITQQAANGCEALKLIETGSFDLITTGVLMLGMNGIELCKELKTRGIATPVVFISGYSDPETDVIKITGAIDFIAKPFTVDRLKSSIEKALQYTHR